MRGGDKKKACTEFLKMAETDVYSSPLIPSENLTPAALYNISDDNKTKLIQAFNAVDKSTMLVIVLGETNLNLLLEPNHAIFNQELVTSFAGKVSVLFIDPDFSSSNDLQEREIPDAIKQKVQSIKTLNAKFPLTPVFGPHKHYNFPPEFRNKNTRTEKGFNYSNRKFEYKQPELYRKLLQGLRQEKISMPGIHESLRRMIHTNALEVLNILVAFENPILIDSRITSICYRSFKYLIDIRASKGRKTQALYEYTVPHSGAVMECDKEFAIFPNPFVTCKEEAAERDLDRYYYNYGIFRKLSNVPERIRQKWIETKTGEKKQKFENSISQMNTWANQEIKKYIPAGGKRKTKKQTSKKTKTRKNKKALVE